MVVPPSSAPGGDRGTRSLIFFVGNLILDNVIQKSCFNQLIGCSYIFSYKLCCWIHSPIPRKKLSVGRTVLKNSKHSRLQTLCFLISLIDTVQLLGRKVGDWDWYCKITSLEKWDYGSFYLNWRKLPFF